MYRNSSRTLPDLELNVTDSDLGLFIVDMNEIEVKKGKKK